METLECYFDKLYNLRVGVVGQGGDRHERPHKPVMLLTVLDLMDAGEIGRNRIEWNERLRERFAQIFEVVRSSNDKATPENPFFYLRSEGFWKHVGKAGKEGLVEGLSNPPRKRELAEGIFHVELETDFYHLLEDRKKRELLREALISRYFPNKQEALADLNIERHHRAAEIDPKDAIARSAAFRKLILATYDYQCVACGMRIRLPSGITMVDAAHLIPFAVSANDHPSNGFTLCKNHHWAFDRHLITPDQEGRWQVSPNLESRRSSGEAELCALAGERMLRPQEELFAPSVAAIEWRAERLVGV
ncbi:MAG: HNH endonuclease [Verrucomicrobiales bacterium]|nr:HNH endonuclease [Verrucomicrobiales bacterium]